jgi:hypothetical protein
MDTLRDVVSVQFVAACLGAALVLVEIFRQGGRYSIKLVTGIGLGSALVLAIGSGYLELTAFSVRIVVLSWLSFFGGYLGAALLVALYAVAVVSLCLAVVGLNRTWGWVSLRLTRPRSRTVPH